MTVQEAERITGLRISLISRYERLGFIHTKAKIKGERTFTEEQVKILLRVRLFRQLMVAEEEIRKLQKGYYSLEELLQCCLEVYEESGDPEIVAPLQRVCRKIIRSQTTFEKLNAYPYLVEIQGMRDGGMYESDGKWWLGYWIEPEPEREYPERRCVARLIDIILLWTILFGIIFIEFSVQPSGDLFCLAGMWALHSILYLLLDAACITLFAATPGKLVMGIRVYDSDRNYLSWKKSLQRSFLVLAYGLGWNLPIWNLYCMWQAYRRELARMEGGYTHVDTLPWEENDWYEYRGSELLLRVRRDAVAFLLVFALYAAWNRGSLPVYRGDITIQEFAVNRNIYARHFTATAEKELSSEGKWVKVHRPGLQDFDVEEAKPEGNYYYVPDQNRILQQLVYREEYRGSETVRMNIEEIKTAVYSFLGTEKNINWFSLQDVGEKVYNYADSPYYEIEINSMTIYYELVLDGMLCEQEKDGWQIRPQDPEKEGYYEARIRIVREASEEETDDGRKTD